MAIIDSITAWSENDDRVKALLMVGSCARGTARPDSDVDLVLLTEDKSSLLANDAWIHQFGTVASKQIEQYGLCTSLRVWYEDGTEIEYGIVPDTWLDIPLDAGTRRVLEDGYRLLYGAGEFTDSYIQTALIRRRYNMINKFLELGNRYAAKSDWKDFALTKFCLCAMGVLIGLCIPNKNKKTAQIAASSVFAATYVPLMAKVFSVLKEMLQEKEA